MLCAKFFGRFKDEHAEEDEDAPVEDDEEEGEDKGGSATIQLAPHMRPVRVEVTRDGTTVYQELLKISAEKKRDFSSGMVAAISDLNKVHTIELVSCNVRTMPRKLPEMYDLRIVYVQGHRLKTLDPRLGLVENLEELTLSVGVLKNVEPTTFGIERFQALSMLNLSNNQLVFLPSDFAFYCPHLEYLDVSRNKLVKFPDAWLLGPARFSMQVLLLEHNKLKELPEDLGNLKELRKLFVSFNQLVKLPKNIGNCRKLEKLRFVQNKLERLPFSILDIPEKHLTEVLAERNPLKVPSLTSFKMGGIELAFQLLREAREAEEKELAAAALAGSATGGVEDESLGRNLHTGGVPANVAAEGSCAAPAGGGVVLAASGAGGAGATSSSSQPVIEQGANPAVGGGGAASSTNPGGGQASSTGPIIRTGNEYYFHKLEGKQTAEVRQIENSLLIAKKKDGIEKVIAHANNMLSGGVGGRDSKSLPEDERERLEFLASCDVSSYHETIAVAEVDLYFYLLVYATKPLYSSCATLFDKFDVGDKGFWTEPEWQNFLMKMPIALPDHVQAQMWKILSAAFSTPGGGSTGGDGSVIPLTVFVAAYHLHELEQKDPQLMRITQLMKLDYYDMDVAEMERRLSAKSSGDAEPTLDFNAAAGPRSAVTIRHEEGEGTHEHSTHDHGAAVSSQTADRERDAKVKKLSEVQVFLDGPAYLTKQLGRGAGDSSDDADDFELKSENLSESSDGSDISFDALEHLAVVVAEEEEKEAKSAKTQTGGDLHSKAGRRDAMNALSQVHMTPSADGGPLTAMSPGGAEAEDERGGGMKGLTGGGGGAPGGAGGGKDKDMEFDLHGLMTQDLSAVVPAKYMTEGSLEKRRASMGTWTQPDTSGGRGLGFLGSSSSSYDPATASIAASAAPSGTGAGTSAASHKGGGSSSKRRGRAAVLSRRQKSDRRKAERPAILDRRFRTDVLGVRKGLRAVYRNVPNEDYARAVNYILKSLKHMKSEKSEGSATYWHALDPTFKNSLGSNAYCVRLIEVMGFILLHNAYWIWPSIHLTPVAAATLVPKNAPGMHSERLDDMILLFTLTRTEMLRVGVEKFNGFVP
ncbi:unnamed protein product [Amoebophrya sp. A25]|nr:unnamed protein product [Amoebophrya sp. A25]|eukprot:GSA25T00007027001.1